MKLRIKSTDLTIKIIGWIQIVGGVIGIGILGYSLLKTGQITGSVLLMLLIGLGLFIFSIYAGKQLLIKRTLKLGLILSIINQTLQIIQFNIAGYGFIYFSGAELSIGYKDNLSFDFDIIASGFIISINSESSEFALMVNVFAVILLIVLFDIWEEIKEDEELVESIEGEEYKYTMANTKK